MLAFIAAYEIVLQAQASKRCITKAVNISIYKIDFTEIEKILNIKKGLQKHGKYMITNKEHLG